MHPKRRTVLSRSISSNGISLITSFEGCRLLAYKCVATEQYYTIGYGHYGADVTPGMVISQSQANSLLKSDLKKFEDKVNKYDGIYQWSQNEFDAMVSFAFNVGSIDQLTQQGQRSKQEVAQKMLQYNKSGGRVLAGLTRRRQAEYALFAKDGLVMMYSALPVLKKGSKGQYVKLAQQKLNAKGIHGGCLKVDGIYGSNTEIVVLEAQALWGLTKDAIIGKRTWEKLLS